MHLSTKSSLLRQVPLIAGLIAVPAGAATIYTNDLGTAVQQDALRIVYRNGDETVTYANDYPTPYPYADLDGDGLVHNAVIPESGAERDYLYKDFYAPVFHTYSAPEISASGSGASSFATNVGVQIEKTGAATYSTMLNPSGTVSARSPQALHASTGADPDYQRIKQFKTALYLASYSGSMPDAARMPRIGNMSVSATVNDAQVGDNVYIYKNDFGSAEQRTGFQISKSGVGFATTSMPELDTDQDNVANRLAFDSTTNVSATLIQKIEAPVGLVFSDPVITATAYGNRTNWASYGLVALSTDGVNFTEVTASGTGGDTGQYDLMADATGNSHFQDLTEVWIQVKLMAGNPNGPRPWIQNVLVSADVTAVPEPASMALLMIGGALMLRRRRQ